jgi:hypothetical protein
MCTMIVKQIAVDGYAKGKSDWFKVSQANVSYDHPFKAAYEHALNIDLVNEALGPAARISAELGPEAARALAETILAVLAQAEAGGYLERAVEAGQQK